MKAEGGRWKGTLGKAGTDASFILHRTAHMIAMKDEAAITGATHRQRDALLANWQGFNVPYNFHIVYDNGVVWDWSYDPNSAVITGIQVTRP